MSEDKLIITWDKFEQDCRSLADQIAIDRPIIPGILAITRGGLFVAGILSHVLNIRKIETLCLESYSSCKSRDNITDHTNFKMPLLEDYDDYEDYLVVDDLVDSGTTLYYVNNLGFESSAVLYRKDKTEFEPSFFVEEIPAKKWIVFPWE